MNIENLNVVLAWLDAGAPEVQTPHFGLVSGFNMAVFNSALKGRVKNDGIEARSWAREDPNDPYSPLHHNFCGAVCCIAGFTYSQFDGDKGFCTAGRHLGLSTRQYEALFYGYNWDNTNRRMGKDFDLYEITPAQAARTIRHLIATGDVKWDLSE